MSMILYLLEMILHTITNLLHQHFRIRDLGDLIYFWILEVVRNNTGIHLLWIFLKKLVC